MGLLKALFGSRPKKIADLEARLSSSNSSLYGEAEFEHYDNGDWSFEVEVKHPGTQIAGPLDVRMDGAPVMQIMPHFSESEGKLSSRRNDTLPFEPRAGVTIEVSCPDGAILTGVLRLDG